MSDRLDPDVEAAIGRAGLAVRRVCEVSTIRSPAIARSVYRIDLVSGATVKARRLEDEETARRLFDLQRRMPDGFARAFGRDGCVLLEEWIDGEVLGHMVPSDAQLFDAASLLAALHASPIGAGPRAMRESTAPWREEAERSLADILAAGKLDRFQVARLRDALALADPKQAAVGLLHVDFCGENMLIDRSGRLRVFDNDRLRIGALGFDVARAWYRWGGLPASAWDRFHGAYASLMPTDEPLQASQFWRSVAVVKSAAFRMRADPARLRIPLERLARMAAEVEPHWSPGAGR